MQDKPNVITQAESPYSAYKRLKFTWHLPIETKISDVFVKHKCPWSKWSLAGK